MAYVAISGDFMTRVNNKINNMARAELSTIGEEPKPVLSGHEPFVTEAMWGNHAHFKESMPTDWCGRTERLNAKFEIPNQFKADGNPFVYHTTLRFTNDDIKTPPRFNFYDNLNVPNTEHTLSQLVEWVSKHHEITMRWKAVTDKITEFLHSCKSANEAVKLWPDVKTYFDAGDIARLETKHGRTETKSAAADVLAGIDTSEVMSAAVIARLSGAQV